MDDLIDEQEARKGDEGSPRRAKDSMDVEIFSSLGSNDILVDRNDSFPKTSESGGSIAGLLDRH